MASDEQQQIAWTAIEKGTTVMSRDGADIGKVSAVVADRQKDIFSGIAFRSGLFDTEQFVPADLIDEITPDQVRVGITEEQAGALEPYEG